MTAYNIITKPLTVMLAIMLASCSQTPLLAQSANVEFIDQWKLADAIKLAENSKRYPYGIKSINTHSDEVLARKICLNTINNNLARWQWAVQNGDKRDYITFLGDRYCPAKDDSAGHKVWANNVRRLYERRIN